MTSFYPFISFQRRHFIVAGAAPWLVGLQSSSQAAPLPQKRAHRILVVGDSLSAEYGLKRGTGWVALLEKKLLAEKMSVPVINASISGDTTSGGRSRMPALLAQHQPTLVVIELGGNDALRGLPLALTHDNLKALTQMAKQAHARVLLLGMQIPPNYGRSYAAAFADAYAKIAQTQRVALVPFFPPRITDEPDSLKWFQADRIHLKEAAHPLVLTHVWPAIQKGLQ
ncbi:arylesterase [Rhodoferax sp.]|uniref:arylesterase n=1 Tax=Rhodoferax sp. TaxID=50421 RepID=UPI00260B3806|nr:arylesterase [Rhodoferax sp.]MDD2811502.1 arylesterase [Rhodoferax sp.]